MALDSRNDLIVLLNFVVMESFILMVLFCVASPWMDVPRYPLVLITESLSILVSFCNHYDLTPSHLLIDEWMVEDHRVLIIHPSQLFNLIHQLFKQWRGKIVIYLDSHFMIYILLLVLIVHILYIKSKKKLSFYSG